jgi:mercuric ion transport protein
MRSAGDQAKKLSIGGAVLAALAASSCCLGPLLLAALGVGGAGAFATLSAFRPYILVGTAALLAVGFYLTYRKPAVVAGDACGCEKPNRAASRASKIGLWAATAMILLFAASPTILARLAERPHAVVAPAAGVTLASITIPVEGMDCEACSVHVRKALTAVGGFHDLKLDLPGHSVAVSYEPAPGRLEAYVKAINDLGYEATLPVGSIAGRNNR